MSKITPTPAVGTAIFNKEGKVLLTKRSGKVREPHKWCLPGGHLDGGETWEQAARREALEEVGLKLGPVVLSGIYSDPSLTITETKDRGTVQFVVAVFICREFSLDVTPNDEVEEWGWFSLDNLPSPMLNSHPIRIQDAFEFTGKSFFR